jgi:hypothetical protein
MPHPAIKPESVAVITGGAAGIGLAAAVRFAELGLRVCIVFLHFLSFCHGPVNGLICRIQLNLALKILSKFI